MLYRLTPDSMLATLDARETTCATYLAGPKKIARHVLKILASSQVLQSVIRKHELLFFWGVFFPAPKSVLQEQKKSD